VPRADSGPTTVIEFPRLPDCSPSATIPPATNRRSSSFSVSARLPLLFSCPLFFLGPWVPPSCDHSATQLIGVWVCVCARPLSSHLDYHHFLFSCQRGTLSTVVSSFWYIPNNKNNNNNNTVISRPKLILILLASTANLPAWWTVVNFIPWARQLIVLCWLNSEDCWLFMWLEYLEQ
jgi:hypothetical protein